MARTIRDIVSISELHQWYGYEKPNHPLVSIIDLSKTQKRFAAGDVMYRLHFYCVYFKTTKGTLPYGRGHYDFEEATLLFTAPQQVVAPPTNPTPDQGWGLFFHPDLLSRTSLAKRINDYSFFNYTSTEALHLSESEKDVLNTSISHIEQEYRRPIDKHTHRLIGTTIELLLNYCDRFYDRQFLTRAKVNHDLVQQFEELLKARFTQDVLLDKGLPDVKYFSTHLNLSAYYLSDILKRYTGKSTQEHIHLKLVEQAKLLLWSTDKPISTIAYDLGFDHPSHFSKLFKTKTGKSPVAFRNA